MALAAIVKDGEIVDSSSSISDSSKKTSSGSTLDKQAFLQLLVAQMKYQDPLEPTSNTEYVAQLATFSQLEATQNLQLTAEESKAIGLVGKAVIMKTTSKTTGDTYFTAGYVDAVYKNNGDVYLYMNDQYFDINDLDTVLEDEYYKEYLKEIENNTDDKTDTDNDTDTGDDTDTDTDGGTDTDNKTE